MSATIDRLIINSPYQEPQRHWRYDRETWLFELVDGGRPLVAQQPGEIRDILMRSTREELGGNTQAL